MHAPLALTLLATLHAGQDDPEALWRNGHRREAVEALAAAVARDPGNAELALALARHRMALGQFAAALADVAPLGDVAAPVRGEALYFLGRYEDALHELDPDRPGEALLVVESLRALGDLDAAEALLPKVARDLGPRHPRTLTLEAQKLERAGDLAGAEARFRAALEEDAIALDALFGLGRLLVKEGRREEGLAVLAEHHRLVPLVDELDFAQRGLQLAPLSAPNHAAVGDIERKLGRLDRAEEAYARAAELATPEQVVPIALRRSRFFAEDRGDLERALAVLDEAVKARPDVRLLVRRGDLLADAGKREAAIEAYERALGVRPGDAAILARLAAAKEGR